MGSVGRGICCVTASARLIFYRTCWSVPSVNTILFVHWPYNAYQFSFQHLQLIRKFLCPYSFIKSFFTFLILVYPTLHSLLIFRFFICPCNRSFVPLLVLFFFSTSLFRRSSPFAYLRLIILPFLISIVFFSFAVFSFFISCFCFVVFSSFGSRSF